MYVSTSAQFNIWKYQNNRRSILDFMGIKPFSSPSEIHCRVEGKRGFMSENYNQSPPKIGVPIPT